jgi:hypothetical protein
MTKNRTFREPLDPVWAEALLSVPSGHSSDKTVAEVLSGLRNAFEKTLKEAAVVLANHPFAEVIAAEAARRAGRRGDPTLVMGEDGHIYLEIHYKTAKAAKEAAVKDDKSRHWHSDLPSITELRKEAEEAGLDPAPYGRSKVKLKQAIDAAKDAAKPKGFHKRTGSPVPATPLSNAIQSAAAIDLDDLD